jgi:hypothetical protein
MELNRTVLAGAGGLVVGLLIGFALSASGRSAVEEQLKQQQEAVAELGKLEAALGAVDSRVGELGTRLGGVEGTLAALGESQSGGLKSLTDRIDGVGTDLSGALSDIGSSVSTALSGPLDGLRAQVAALASAPPAAGGQEAASGAPAQGELVRVGETAQFDGGAVRVFLSALDGPGAAARVAINGSGMSLLALGSPVEAGNCRLTLTGVSENGATIAGDCGALEPVQGSGLGTAIPVGAAGMLADGKLRVFVSGFDAEDGTARVAVNGFDVIKMKMSEPVEAGDCKLTLTGIADGAATIDAGC